MKYFRNMLFFYSSFLEKSGRIEYGIYTFFTILMQMLALYLYQTINLNNETILHIFYSCFIVLFTFVPMQATTARRLRDLNANPAFLIFNFIPVLNIVFIAFLLLARSKK